jgi:uncharacterized protein YjbI with pentapeptide repeats
VVGIVIAVILTGTQILTSWYLNDRATEANRRVAQEVMWRQVLGDGPDARVVGARLDDLDLAGVAGSGADLQRASAVRTDFSDAFLTYAIMASADLTDADLDGARLRGVSLNAATLDGASFRGSDLRDASLHLATVDGADFTGANLIGADFRG